MTAITHEQFMDDCDRMGKETKVLVEAALASCVPDGYFMSDDRDLMYANALTFVRPKRVAQGVNGFYFYHRKTYRPDRSTGPYLVIPSVERVSVTVDIHTGTHWETDAGFGEEGRLAVDVVGGDLVSAVRELVSMLMTTPLFANFEWRKCPHDPLKYELFSGATKVQSVWKSGNVWGTLVGNSHKTLQLAKVEAEAAARQAIKSFHDERLAGLNLKAA